jgi:hypothetical protein
MFSKTAEEPLEMTTTHSTETTDRLQTGQKSRGCQEQVAERGVSLPFDEGDRRGQLLMSGGPGEL